MNAVLPGEDLIEAGVHDLLAGRAKDFNRDVPLPPGLTVLWSLKRANERGQFNRTMIIRVGTSYGDT
ncbi:MAG TPA: hypothetical protein VGJ48_15845 [Pyrinomonadaceae bacterium]|jgi:hypothetical protein